MQLIVYTPRGRYDVGRLGGGDDGINATVAAMLAVVQDAVRSPDVAALAKALPSDGAIFNVLRGAQRFVRDPAEAELIRTPDVLAHEFAALGSMTGDCDDLACLGAALLAIQGTLPVLITVGRRPAGLGGRLEHVFFGHLIDMRGETTRANVFPLDPQETHAPGEWPRVPRVRIFRATGAHAP